MTEETFPKRNNDEKKSSQAPNRFFMTPEELQRSIMTLEEVLARNKMLEERRAAYHEQWLKEPEEVTLLKMEMLEVLTTATSSQEEEEAKQRKLEQLDALIEAALAKAAEAEQPAKADDEANALSNQEE